MSDGGDYRQRFLREDARAAAAFVAVVSLAYLAFGLADPLHARTRAQLVATLSVRVVFMLVGAVAAWAVLRTRRPAVLDRWVLAWSVAFALRGIVVQSTRPGDYLVPLMGEVAVALSLLIIVPVGLPFQAASAATVTAGALTWMLAFRDPLSRDELAVVLSTWAMANALGFLASRHAHRLRRVAWLENLRLVDAEHEARNREARFRALFDNPALGVAMTRVGQGFLDVNERYCAMLGCTRDELMARNWRDFTHPDDLERDVAGIAALLAGKIPVYESDKRYLRKDGSLLWVHVSATCARNPDGSPDLVLALALDISERKAAEEALLGSEARFRSLADQAPIGVVEVDLAETRLLYANREAAAIAGRSLPELLAAPLGSEVHPDDVPAVREAFTRVVQTGARTSLEFRVRRPDGAERLVRVDGSLLRDAAGRPRSYLGLEVDVTEMRAAQQALAVRSRLEAMGTLVAGVGHEINNPLAALMAGEGLALEVTRDLLLRLRSGTPPTPAELERELEENRTILEEGLESGNRIARIVKDLAAFGRSRTTRETVRLREVVDAAIRWLPAAAGGPVAVEVEDRGAPDVQGLPGQLSQVVLNLLSNACRAGREGRPPRIRVRLGPGAPGTTRLEVEDDGVGMSPETLARVFDPFFTTRPAGDQRGVGLGLPVCHAIVTAHGGTIAAVSELGQGSTFTLELPVAPRPDVRSPMR